MISRFLASFVLSALIVSAFPTAEAFAQSGRKRARNPGAEESPPPQPNVKIPLATSVVTQEQHGTVSRFGLKNGITVIVNEMHGSPVAAAASLIKTDPASGNVFASRVLQQLILIGGTLAPQTGAAPIAPPLGAVSNTGVVYAGSYFVTRLPASGIKDALSYQSELIQHPALPADRLNSAIDAVQAGQSNLCFDALTYSRERAAQMALTGAPEATPTALTIDQVQGLYKDTFKPETLVVAVTGDVSTFDVLVYVEQIYGDFGAPPPQPAQPAVLQETGNDSKSSAKPVDAVQSEKPTASQNETKPDAAQQQTAPVQVVPKPSNEVRRKANSGLVYREERGPLNQTVTTLAYRLPGLDHQDWAAGCVLAALMGDGPGSLLGGTLVDELTAARAFRADYNASPGLGLLTVQMQVSPDSLDKAESAYFKNLDRLLIAAAPAENLGAAKKLAQKKLYNRLGAGDSRAVFLAFADAAGRSAMLPAEYAGLIDKVTAADIRRVAQRYLILRNTAVLEYEPGAAPPRTFDTDSYARTVVAWAPGIDQPNPGEDQVGKPKPEAQRLSAAEAMATADGESVQPEPVKDFSTLNGPKAYVREDHSTPTVSVALLFQGGRVTETQTNAGITELMLRSMLSATKRMNTGQLAARFAGLGAEVEVVNEPDFFGFLLSGLSSSSDRALKVLHDVIEDPSFDDVDIERARNRQMAAIAESNDNGEDRAVQLLFGGIYPGHPYGYPPHGDASVVAKLKPEEVKDWYKETVLRQFPIVIIVGDTQGSQLVSDDIAGGFPRRDLLKAIKAQVPQKALIAQKVEPAPCTRTLVFYGLAGPRSNSKDLAALEVAGYAADLAGLSRDGIYPAGSLRTDALLTAGAIYAQLNIKASDQPKSRTAFLATLQNMAQKGVTSDQTKSAKALAQTVSNEILRSQRGRVLAYAAALFSGRPPSYVDSYEDTLGTVTPDEIKRVVSTYLKSDQLSTVVLLEKQPSSVPAPAAKP